MYAVLGKKGLQILSFALLLCFLFVAEGFLITRADESDIRSPERRIAYLGGIDVEVDESTLAETEVTIPENFNDVYKNYNKIQIEAGFNLENYKGLTVTRYTYRLSDEANVFVNMLCYKGKVIGGDISSCELGGFMLPLAKRKQEDVKNGDNAVG